MQNFKRKIFWTAVFNLLFATSVLASPQGSGDSKYRIGAILPLSGSAASLGQYLKKGLDLAYNKLPAEKRDKIEIFYEDDELKSAKAVSALQKLKATQQIDAAFVLGSGIGNAVAPIAERDKMLLVAIGASDGNIVKGRRYAFLHWVTPQVEAEKLAQEIRKRGYKTLSIISTEQEGAIAVFNAVKTSLKKGGLENRVASEETFLPNETDFKTHIAKLRSLKTDCVVVLLFPGALASFAKQSRDLKLGADLAGIELFEDEHEVKASQGALVGQWYVNADAAAGSFMTLYREAYHEQPGWGAANAFDTLNLVAEGAAKFGRDTEKIVDFLASLKDYRGAAGIYSSTGDNRFTLPAAIKIVKKDGFEKLY